METGKMETDQAPSQEGDEEEDDDDDKIMKLIEVEFRVISEARRRLKSQKVAKYMNEMAIERGRICESVRSLYDANAVDEIPELKFLTTANSRPAKTCSVTDQNSHRHSAPLFLLSVASTIPSVRTFCTLKKNLFIEDQRELPYLPYFENEDGDSSTFLTELLEQQYEGRFHTTPVLALPAEQNKEALAELFQVLISKHRSEIGPLDNLPSLIYDALPNLQWNLTQLTDLKDQIVNSKPDPTEHAVLPNIDGPEAEQTSPEVVLNSYMMLFCQRCFRYDCHLHPYLPPPVNNEKNRPPPVPSSVDLMMPCSAECYKLKLSLEKNALSPTKNSRKRNSRVLDPSSNWSNGELTSMRVLALHVFGADYCKLAMALFKPCCEVYEVATQDNLVGLLAKSAVANESLVENGNPEPAPNGSSSNYAKRKANQKASGRAWLKKLWTLQNLQKRSQGDGAAGQAGVSGNGMANPYEPCSACGDRCEPATCKCHLSGNFCEKYCQCQPDLCRYRFPGCHCESCLTSRCPCLAANRECDPDVCRPCQQSLCNNTTADYNLQNYYADPPCRNVSIQRGQRKRLLVAPSDIAGWGCFVKDAVERNEFISEYVGELISQEEAERRGRVYDRIGSSFLFNLNSEYAVDAMRKGNKIRFANHSRQPNCFARVMLVNGDHRIGIYAKRAIAAGEELFFDYYYNREQLRFVSVERSVTSTASTTANPSTSTETKK